MDDVLVNFLVLRHGQRLVLEGEKQDKHSSFGLDQLIATTEEHLNGVVLDAAYCSDKLRTREAVDHILRYRGEGLIINEHPAFAVSQYFSGMNGIELDHIESHIGEHGTAEEWLRLYSKAQQIADGMVLAFTEIADWLVFQNPHANRPFNVLVGYHAPLCNLPSKNPGKMGPVNLADIVKHETRKRGSRLMVTNSVHLRCSLLERAA